MTKYYEIDELRATIEGRADDNEIEESKHYLRTHLDDLCIELNVLYVTDAVRKIVTGIPWIINDGKTLPKKGRQIIAAEIVRDILRGLERLDELDKDSRLAWSGMEYD